MITSASATGRIRTAEFLDTNTRPITTDELRTLSTLSLRSIAQKHQTDAVSVSVINRSDVIRLPCANMLGQKAKSSSETVPPAGPNSDRDQAYTSNPKPAPASADRKSTRLNSSHLVISYAVF